MKIKVAIVTRQMIAGGIERALISMLEEMDKDKFDITLFLMASEGEFMKYIPSNVKVRYIFGNEKSIYEKVLKLVKKYELFKAIKTIYYYSKSMIVQQGYHSEECLRKLLSKIDESFDIAISYHVPASFPVIFVSEYLKADKKFAWIHSDVEMYEEDLKRYISYYSKFNKIFCVSKHGMDKFNKKYPELSKKTEVLYNIMNKDKIYKLANEYKAFNDDFDGIRIVTVGRLTEQKGQDIIAKIIHKLNNKANIRWYLVGEGELRKEINKLIINYNLQEKLILVGNKNNPYPYFKECDIYVQPSRHEGYCITLAEAKLFNKPIITTDFVGAREQIVNNKTGVITEFDLENLYKDILDLILNKEKRIDLSKALTNINYINNI